MKKNDLTGILKRQKNQTIWAYYPVTALTAIFCCILWGSAAPAIKIAYNLFQISPDDTASRILLAGARFTLAGLLALLLVSAGIMIVNTGAKR